MGDGRENVCNVVFFDLVRIQSTVREAMVQLHAPYKDHIMRTKIQTSINRNEIKTSITILRYVDV